MVYQGETSVTLYGSLLPIMHVTKDQEYNSKTVNCRAIYGDITI